MQNTLNKFTQLSLATGLALVLMVPSTTTLAAAPLPSVEDRLNRIERIIENPVLLQLSRRLGEQQREIQDLQDEIDFLKRDLRKAEQAAGKRYKETDDRLSVLEKVQAEAKAKASSVFAPMTEASNQSLVPAQEQSVGNNGTDVVQTTVPEVAPTVEEPPVNETKQDQEAVSKTTQKQPDASMAPITTLPATDEEKAAYQSAFNLIKSAKYDESITAFQLFLSQYPKSDLASNASYWAGEAYYIKEKHQAALDAFTVVIKRYPNSLKVSDAMLRAADCLDNLSQKNEARKMYSDLMTLHPTTRAAQKAEQRLKSL